MPGRDLTPEEYAQLARMEKSSPEATVMGEYASPEAKAGAGMGGSRPSPVVAQAIDEKRTRRYDPEELKRMADDAEERQMVDYIRGPSVGRPPAVDPSVAQFQAFLDHMKKFTPGPAVNPDRFGQSRPWSPSSAGDDAAAEMDRQMADIKRYTPDSTPRSVQFDYSKRKLKK